MKTIFVSSTFKDMHFERDAIQETTLPMLKKEAAKYGDNVHFCDLRWGINTGDLDSEEGSRKVLDVCLDEIDRCSPPMVVILGDRYGWIPSEELTESVTGRKRLDKSELQRKMELEDLKISVTALEIAYGAMASAEKSRNTLFYFRHIESENIPEDFAPEDEEHAKKLAVLKQRIIELTDGRVKTYNVRWNGSKLEGVDDFAKMLAEDIKNELLPEWERCKDFTPFEREINTHISFVREKNSMFSSRKGIVDRYFSDLTQGSTRSLIIKAPSGSGKSMIWGNLALRLINCGYRVLPIVCGLTPGFCSAYNVLKGIVYWLEELLNVSHTVTVGNTEAAENVSLDLAKHEQLKSRYSELCRECAACGKRIFIMLDAVDCLYADEARDSMIFMPEVSENVGFVMTALPEVATPGCSCTVLPEIDRTEKGEIINGILHAHGRELEGCVIEKMINSSSSDNPLYLSLLVQRLLMMNRDDFMAIKSAGDGMSAITNRQLEIIDRCPDSLQKMSAALLEEAGARINEGLVMEVASLLAVSRFGLREEDLAVLLCEKWSALDFVHFIYYMNENFIRRADGRFDFSHRCIREGFISLCKDEKETHKRILNYLRTLPDGDPLKTYETVYHCFYADDKEYFIDYVESCVYNTEAYNAASADIFLCSMTDGGKWVCSLFECEKKSYGLANFISSSFISGTPSELAVAQTVLAANVKYTEDNAELFSQVVVSLAYNNFAFVCASIGGNANLYTAYLYYFRALTSIREAQKAYPNIDYREDVALRAINYAVTILKYGGEKNYNDAVNHFSEAIRIREELYNEDKQNLTRIRNLAVAYDELGSFISEFSTGENRNNAEEYLKRSLELKKDFAGKIPDVDYRDGIINSYVYLAKLFSLKASLFDEVVDKTNSKDAVFYLESALPLIRQNYSVTRNSCYVLSEMNVNIMLGTIYGKQLGAVYDPQKSCQYHDAARRIYQTADQNIITDRMKELYAFSLNGLAISITVKKEKARYGEAIAMYEEAIELLDELSKKNSIPYVKLQLVTVCSNCGALYSRMNTLQSYAKGIAYCERAEEIIKELEKNGALTPDLGKRALWLYNGMVDLYTKQFRIFKAVIYTIKLIEAKSLSSSFSFTAKYDMPKSGGRKHQKLKIVTGKWLQRLTIATELLILIALLFSNDYTSSVSAGSWSLVISAVLVYLGSILAEKRMRIVVLLLYLFGVVAIWGLMNGFIHAMLT